MAAMDLFDEYFKQADLDRDGRISGAEAVAFFQRSNLPKQVLAQVWMHADQNRTGFLGRTEFYNALKLVTVAQSGRQFTPEIVKSALYGPAAAKIPAPKISPVSSTLPPINSAAAQPAISTNTLHPPSNQFSSITPNAPQNPGFRPTQAPQNAVMNQQFFPTANSNFTRPPLASPIVASPQMQAGNLGLVRGSVAGPRPPSSSNSSLSTDWLTVKSSRPSVGVTSHPPIRGSIPTQTLDGFGLALSGATGVPSNAQIQSIQASSYITKPNDQNLPPSTPTQLKSLVASGKDLSSNTSFARDLFSATSQVKSDAQVNPSIIAPVASGPQSSIRPRQLDPTHIVQSVLPVGSQLQQTQLSVKQNQFDNLKTSPSLSAPNAAELANSALNQAWPKISQADIKKYTNVFVNVDKDRDGKITGEQARSLFLSWKLPREVLKQVWDLSDQDNDSMLSLREFCIALYLMERYREGHSLPPVLPNSVMYDETLLRAAGMPSAAGVPMWQPGLPQQGQPGHRPPIPTGVRSQMPNSIPSQAYSAGHLVQQNLATPGPNNNIVKNLGRDGHTTLNSDHETTNLDSKIQQSEKQILDSKEKLEFYRTKMQELVLYKSRCDNKLNEITERASVDKREVELLAKKYEEKYKQVGELASKMALDEVKYRDIQERKAELQSAITKMDQGGSVDGLLQVRVDRIQSDLESLEKALSERCKQHGVHVKATTTIDLPFGWESVPVEGADQWDEDWNKFEDEGFTVTKELTSAIVNSVVNGELKSPTIWSDKASTEDNSPIASSFSVDGKIEKLNGIHEHMNGSAYDNSEEGSTKSPTSSPGRSTFESPFNSTQFRVNEVSSYNNETHSDHADAESSISGEKYNDDPWTFDDTASAWKENDYEGGSKNTFFMSDFDSVKADSPSAGSVFEKEKRSSFFDDSVPSSPMFNSSSSAMFNDGRDGFNFNSFSRFDSFATHDSGSFPARENFSRFDSISSAQPETLARFDSISSNRDFGHRKGAFESFDDADPFGSTGPFKSSGGNSPRQGSVNWRAF
ncbi:epidermal growth factor receptor substrate 15-like 1 [Zingiber officinale]|uniref:epidermal growth factor receptor substrate 15-like 1 n=1 Tax=Zingiber officinale TaxID=94328 RepID=UPI001C4B841C|nr:epidermal growth factor receptor substrate 15-like 1 [Zingiber officinale]